MLRTYTPQKIPRKKWIPSIIDETAVLTVGGGKKDRGSSPFRQGGLPILKYNVATVGKRNVLWLRKEKKQNLI